MRRCLALAANLSKPQQYPIEPIAAVSTRPTFDLMKKHLNIFFIATLLVLFSALAVIQRPATYYPLIEIGAPVDPVTATAPNTSAPNSASPADILKLTFLFDAHPTLQSCEALTGNIARVVLAKCPSCSVRQLQCVQALDAAQQAMLSDQPLTTASGRMTVGAVIFAAANPDLALGACQQTEIQSAGGPQPVTCYAPNTKRSKPAPKPIEIAQIGLSLLAFLAAAFGAWFACWLIVKYEHLHAHLSHDPTDSGPQKFHAVPTPRIGGIGLIAGLMAAGGVMMLADKLPHEREFGLLLLAGIPAFLGGLVDDITKKVGVLERLLLTMLSGAVAAWLLGAVLNRLDIPGVDQALLWLSFAIVFTVFAVGGVANAINIIDGYNGVAAGYAFIILIAITVVAIQVSDMLVFVTALSMAGALLGFLKWNWPGGKIFLGDGGAYLLGFILAELSIILVARNQNVSPWFPLVLLIYPVFETFFSIYRKRFVRGHSAGHPDGLHFHMLIYKRLVRVSVGSRDPRDITQRNSAIAVYIWAMSACCVLPAIFFWRETGWLIAFTVMFCASYVWLYRRIVRWRAPTWLIRRSPLQPSRFPANRDR